MNPLQPTPSLHVVLCADKNFLRPAGITVASLLQENSDLNLVVHLLCDEIPDADLHRYHQLFDAKPAELRIHRIDPDVFSELPLASGYPKAIFYRLLAPDLLACETDRILYLDGDILCLGSIRYLAEVDLTSYVIAAVSDIKESADLRIGPLGLHSGKYFNSGVLLINVQRWVEDRVTERVIDALAHLPLVFPDQDALNVVNEGKVLYLDNRWNAINPKDEDDMAVPVVLRHFAIQNAKPWKLHNRPLHSDRYRKVYRASPWGDIPLDPPVTRSEKKTLSKISRKDGQYFTALIWFLRYLCTPRKPGRM